MQWPSKIKGGSTCNALIGLQDLMATFSEILGLNLEDSQAVDSISFMNLLLNHEREGKRTNLIMASSNNGPFVIRSANWKLCLTPGVGAKTRYGNIPDDGDSWSRAFKILGKKAELADWLKAPFVQLYDMDKDIKEVDNQAYLKPEKITSMVEELQDQIDKGRSTPGSILENDHPVNILSLNSLYLNKNDNK